MHAYDMAPADNLNLIERSALERAHFVVAVKGGPLGPICGLNSIERPDVIVTGLSSVENSGELELGKIAQALGIPWVVSADDHRNWARPAARGLVSHAILLVASNKDVPAARAFGYGRAEYLGGPPLWQDWHRETERKRQYFLGGPIVLVGGNKNALITDQVLAAVVEKMNDSGLPWGLIFKPHRRENEEVNPARRARILADANLIAVEGRPSELLGIVDLVVVPAGSTLGIMAAHRRVPVIDFENEAIRRRLLEQDGSADWFPAEAGASLRATAETLADVVKQLLTPEGAAELRRRQEEVYPDPPPGGERVETRIVRFLENLVSNR